MPIQVRQVFVAGGVAALMVGFFIIILDLHTRFDVAIQVLSIGPVLLALLSPHESLPFEATSLVAQLIGGGGVVSPRTYDSSPWVPVLTHLFRMAVIGVPVWYFINHREHEVELQRLNDGVGMRPQARTEKLAAVNESNVAEVLERMRIAQSLEASRWDPRQLASQLLCVQEEERRRISRDLHDDFNQRLALLAIDVEALERQLSTAPIGTVRAVQAIQDRIIELSDDVRHLAHQLHPSILDDLGLSIALQRLVDDFTARTGVKGQFIDYDTPKLLAQEVATCLYRIVQESLGNVSRHAKAKQVRIELVRLRNGLQLTVSDDGVGFDMTRLQHEQGGLGLLSMKERVALVDGTLDIQSAEGEGTRVRAWVPLEKWE